MWHCTSQNRCNIYISLFPKPKRRSVLDCDGTIKFTLGSCPPTQRAPSSMSSFTSDDPELLSQETLRLRRHIGLGDRPEMPPPEDPPAHIVLFFIECALDSRNGAACKLPTCTEKIRPGE